MLIAQLKYQAGKIAAAITSAQERIEALEATQDAASSLEDSRTAQHAMEVEQLRREMEDFKAQSSHQLQQVSSDEFADVRHLMPNADDVPTDSELVGVIKNQEGQLAALRKPRKPRTKKAKAATKPAAKQSRRGRPRAAKPLGAAAETHRSGAPTPRKRGRPPKAKAPLNGQHDTVAAEAPAAGMSPSEAAGFM